MASMRSEREEQIRSVVRRDVHLELWRRRAEWFPHPVRTVADMLPIDLAIVSSHIYNLLVAEADELDPEEPFVTSAAFETARHC
jgi:hypothetical protein